MQLFRTLEYDTAARVGWGVRVLLASPTGTEGHLARRLSGLGGLVEVEAHLYDALSVVMDDSRAAQMLVVDCDAYGGLGAARRACALLGPDLGLSVVLITAECAEQLIPQYREAPIVLRAPVSAVALRVAFDAAFCDRRIVGPD